MGRPNVPIRLVDAKARTREPAAHKRSLSVGNQKRTSQYPPCDRPRPAKRSEHVLRVLREVALLHAREVTMHASRSIVPSKHLAEFRLEPRSQTLSQESTIPADQQFRLLANGLVELLETARRELDGDREVAKTSLITASNILHVQIERCSGANGFPRGGLVDWQIARVRAYIDRNLHRTIHIRDLSAVVRRSTAHFSRKFKLSFGESPHAYVTRRRLEKACGLSGRPLGKVRLAGDASAAFLARSCRATEWKHDALENIHRVRGAPG
jgi:AraC family transcriptional regulator